MVSNHEISRLFGLYAELLLLHNKDERLSGLLSNSAYRIKRMTEVVAALSKPELLKQFRPEVVSLVNKLNSSGNLEELDELIQLTPSGLFEMMRIKGLGGNKLHVLWKTAKIDTIEVLLDACKRNKLSTIPGFGQKTQENIISAIDAYQGNKNRFHYASVADLAEDIEQTMRQIFKTELISLCGEIRRQATTVAAIEIIAAVTSKKSQGIPRKLMIIESSNKEQTTGQTTDEIPIIIYHTAKTGFYYELFKRTGSDTHTEKVLSKIETQSGFTSEEAIYKKVGLPFILPEMREDVAEWIYIKGNGSLVSLEDIKGVVHNHTDWSDGVDSLADFVHACKTRGYDYVVISDHSKNAHYAGGLKEEKVIQQFKAIDQLNKSLTPFKIFKSIECDILVSGDLDYGNNLLKQFDLVIISIHQLLKMGEEKATKRLIKAIENPYTTILGHMTGRQLLIRPGYPVDFKKVIDACAANGVVIEINANPYRLDMDWSHIPYAFEKEVMISINPDAHSIAEIDNIRWGVSAARKGGLTKEMTWNAMPLKGIEKWLKKKHP